jgi:hypothetical protein
MKHKNRLTEANKMRKLMGLDFIAESKEAISEIEKAQKMAEARALKEKELKSEGHYIDEDDVIGTGDTGASDEDGAPESEKGLKKFDDDELFEDSEGEETYHYGSDEGEDEERIDHDDLSGGHIEALKKDMAYDEDHEDRREKGTDFWEQKTFKIKKGGKVINLTERDIKKLRKVLLKEETKRGKGCAESEGGSGCIKKGKYVDKDGTEYSWHILNNKHGGVFKGCTSKKDCESILRVPGVHKG